MVAYMVKLRIGSMRNCTIGNCGNADARCFDKLNMTIPYFGSCFALGDPSASLGMTIFLFFVAASH